MKCITIQQPWAWLIVARKKDVENRTWVTSHRGPILIHAAKVVDLDGYYELKKCGFSHLPAIPKLVKGAIIGEAVLYRCTNYVTSGWHEVGQYGFYLRDQKMFEVPIPYRGQLGIFEVTAEAFEAALARAKRECNQTQNRGGGA